MLFPQDSETRQVRDLSGLWRFQPDFEDAGISAHWEKAPLTDFQWMPVPASYNDLTQDARLRDHAGRVWYETDAWVPAEWWGEQVRVRVASGSPRRPPSC